MKDKGFTLIELITTFALSAVIMILLINVIRNIYSKTDIKTELYINQSNLSNLLNKKINNGNLNSYTSCGNGEFCYEFKFLDGDSIRLTVEERRIKFGNFTYVLDKKTRAVNPTLTKEFVVTEDINSNDSFLIIKIPIKNDLYPNIDFGINLVYQYNSSKVTLEES